MNIVKPTIDSLSEYYKSYFDYVPETEMMKALIEQKELTEVYLKSIPVEKESFRYADEKWMLKEVVGHLCDTERILSYRALRFSRNDSTELSAFSENDYVPNSNHAQINLEALIAEKSAIRNSTIMLFKNMNNKMIDRTGNANKISVSVQSILFFIIAHERHHLKVIKEKYI